MTFSPDQYNAKKTEPASGAEESFSEAAFKADSGKTLSAQQQQFEKKKYQFEAEAVADQYIGACVAAGMTIKDDQQREFLKLQFSAAAITNRTFVVNEAVRIRGFRCKQSSNKDDWYQVYRRLMDQCDAANAGESVTPADGRPRWFLTDVETDVSRAEVTFDRQEAADRQKDGWSVIGPEVDDELWRDEKSGHWYRQYLDGSYGKVDVRGLSEWKRELQGVNHDLVA